MTNLAALVHWIQSHGFETSVRPLAEGASIILVTIPWVNHKRREGFDVYPVRTLADARRTLGYAGEVQS